MIPDVPAPPTWRHIGVVSRTTAPICLHVGVLDVGVLDVGVLDVGVV
jgi:hypothetical protein